MTEISRNIQDVLKHQRLRIYSQLQTLGYGLFLLSEDSIPLVEKLLSDLIIYKRKYETLLTKEKFIGDNQDRSLLPRSSFEEDSGIQEQFIGEVQKLNKNQQLCDKEECNLNKAGYHDQSVKSETDTHKTKTDVINTCEESDTQRGDDVQNDELKDDDDADNRDKNRLKRRQKTYVIKTRKHTDFKPKSTLKRNIISSHQQKNISIKSKVKTFLCDDCPMIFKTSSVLHRHVVKIHGIQTESSHNARQNENGQEKDQTVELDCTADVSFSNESEESLLQEPGHGETEDSDHFEDISETYSNNGDRNPISDCEMELETTENIGNKTTVTQSKTAKLKRGRPKRNGARTEFPCKDCEEVFEASWKLNVHRHRVHKIKPTECDICGKQYRNERDMRRHKAYAHVRAKAITCDKCGKRFKNKICLKNHRKLHDEKLDFKCELCPKSFSTKYTLEKHVIKTHENNDSNIFAKYTCHICGKTFEHNSYLTVHIDSVHAKLRPYVCEVCGKAFPTQCYLAYHKRRLHSDVTLDLYKCKSCQKTYRHRSSLSHHEKLHQKQHAYVCHMCGQEFTQKCSLDRHDLIIHKGIKPFVCLICNARFRDSFTVQNHLVTSHSIPKQQTHRSCNLWDKQVELNN